MKNYLFKYQSGAASQLQNMLFFGKGGLFYCGLFLWIATRIFEQSMIVVTIERSMTVFKGLELIALLMIMLHELSTLRNEKYPIIVGFCLMAIIMVTTLISQRLYLLQLAIIIFVGRNCDLKKSLRCALHSTAFTAALVVVLSLLLLIPNYLFLWGGRERYGLGFKYATYLPAITFSCIILYGYIYSDKISYLYLISCTMLEIILFVLTDARFLCPLGIAAALALFISTRPGINLMPILKFVPLLFVIFPLISYQIAVMYSPANELLYQLNSLLSSRLQLSQNAIEIWGVSFLGADVESNTITWVNGVASLPEEVNVVDSSYISSLISYGLIVTIIFLAGYALIAAKAVESGDSALLMALLMVSIMGLIEPRLLVLEYNPLIISIGTLFHTKHLDSAGASLANTRKNAQRRAINSTKIIEV